MVDGHASVLDFLAILVLCLGVLNVVRLPLKRREAHVEVRILCLVNSAALVVLPFQAKRVEDLNLVATLQVAAAVAASLAACVRHVGQLKLQVNIEAAKELLRRAAVHETFVVRHFSAVECVRGGSVKQHDGSFRSFLAERLALTNDLLERADFVCVHCDLNPTSEHLMSTAEFAKMKETAVLINLARGPLVDERALIQALESGKIAGAALDVFEDEPLPKDSPLLTMDNVMVAPHNSNSSPEAWERVHWSTLNNLLRDLKASE